MFVVYPCVLTVEIVSETQHSTILRLYKALDGVNESNASLKQAWISSKVQVWE